MPGTAASRLPHRHRAVVPLVSRRRLAPIALCAALVATAPAAGAQGPTAAADAPKKPFAAFSESAMAMRDSLVSRAREQLGVRYRLGGAAPERGFDCSGFIRYVLAAFDVVLPRSAQQQAAVGVPVSKDVDALQPGDLLTFGTKRRITHVGLYIGEGRMIHASTSQRRIIETSVTNRRSSLIRQWQGVRRLVDVAARDSLLALADGTP
jgi:cell wall-associated NlpC family hydrolase